MGYYTTFHDTTVANWSAKGAKAIEVRKFEFPKKAIEWSEGIWLTMLKVPEVGLRTYCSELIVAKLDFLLWEWNWVCAAMVQKCNDGSTLDADGHWGNTEQWQIFNWERVLGRCAGENDDLTFDNESVKVTRVKEKTYAGLFKKPRTGKNEYWTTGYHNCLRRNVAVALI